MEMTSTNIAAVHKADNSQLVSILRDLVTINVRACEESKRLMQESRSFSSGATRR